MSTVQPRQAVVTIYGGDYLDRINHLRRKAEAAAESESGQPRMLGEKSEAVRLAEEHDGLVAEAEGNAIHVKLQALGRRKWRDLVDEHPPRDGHDGDKQVGVNEDTFKDELVPASIVEPAFSSRAAVDEFTDQLSDVDYERLYLTAFSLNRMVAADPKASLVSRLTQQSDETSS